MHPRTLSVSISTDKNEPSIEIRTVWLNGGPGCSSLTGLTSENGPLQFKARTPIPSPNPNSWTKLANVLYIDQPLGTGFSGGSKVTSDIADITFDFFHWLQAFYDRFPTLKSKNTYIMGESYAGIYVCLSPISLFLR